MPEPTTGDGIDILRGKVERWAPQGVSDVMCSLADLAGLLTAYDQQDNDLTALSIDVSEQSKRADEAEARAAAAEAAVQRVREVADRLMGWPSRQYRRAAHSILDALADSAPLGVTLSNGEPVNELRGLPLPDAMEYTAEDEADWNLRMRRYGLDPDTLPMLPAGRRRRDPRAPLLPDAALHQRLRDAMQREESTSDGAVALQGTDPSAPGFSPVDAVKAFMDSVDDYRRAEDGTP